MKKIISAILLCFLCKAQAQDAYTLVAQAKQLDMPLLTITTKEGKDPTFERIDPPAGAIGTGITNNDYVEGRMIMTLHNDTIFDTEEYNKDVAGMRIRVRGNSTGAFLHQKPYKIKLSKKADLLMRNDKTKRNKNWALMSMYVWNPTFTSAENNIQMLLGEAVSKAVGINWVPTSTFVNVAINGQYQGMYYLHETIDKGEGRVNIEEDGFLIEDDPYWWNQNGEYFKTSMQDRRMGWTFKSPDMTDLTQQQLDYIKDYIESFEKALYEVSDVSQYIDVVSFAKWILAHDILGSYDAAGSNIYCYKTSAREEDKLKMGPLWDFDTCFRVSDNWSKEHEHAVLFFKQLFKHPEFVAAYYDLYMRLCNTIENDINKILDERTASALDVFDAAMSLHQQVHPNEGNNLLKDQITETKEKLHHRLSVIQQLMQQYSWVVGIGTTEAEKDITGGLNIYDIQGRQLKDTPSHGIHIWQSKDNHTTKKVIR